MKFTMRPSGPLAAVLLTLQAHAASIESCPGYAATNIVDSGSTLTADLTLNGAACNAYGYDLGSLSLVVEYQTSKCSY
jgi:alpha-glucosidase